MVAKKKSAPKKASKPKSKSKPAAKAKTSKPAAPKTVKPVKAALSKSALLTILAEENGITRKQAAGVFASLEGVILGSVHPKGAGSFVLPGLMKITLRKVPARKAGTLVRNPGTGEMMPAAAKPASVRVKVRPLKKLKTAAGN